METFLQDLKYAVRMLVKKPGFTLVAVLSLTLGIGANTTIFTMTKAIFLQSVGAKDPSSLMMVFSNFTNRSQQHQEFLPISYLNARDVRDKNQVFSSSSVVIQTGTTLTISGKDTNVFCELVNGNFFEVMGVEPALGRWFSPEEDGAPGAHPVVVLSYALWQKQFGGDRDIVNKTVKVNGQPFAVVGVAPSDFHDLGQLGSPDVLVPIAMHDQILIGVQKDWFNQRPGRMVLMVGRLKPGISERQADSSLQALAHGLEAEFPKDNSGRGLMMVPITNTIIPPAQHDNFFAAGTLMSIIVGLVLLIACANVANLLLARGTHRQREIAIRLSMGASRTRLLRQLLTESMLLGLLAGILGVACAFTTRPLITKLLPNALPPTIDLSVDGRVLAFTLALSLLATLLFGLMPALQTSRKDRLAALRDRTDVPTGSTRWYGLRGILVMLQVALSLIALVGAGLFIHSLRNAQQIDPGFEVQHGITFLLNLGAEHYPQAKAEQFYQDVAERVRALPMVAGAAVADHAPFTGTISRTTFPQGADISDPREGILTPVSAVQPGYFAASGMTLEHGRDFNDHDDTQGARVAIVNQATARQFWPNQDPVGKHLHFLLTDWDVNVVGVVNTVKFQTLGEPPQSIIYFPLKQNYTPAAFLWVRTRGDLNPAIASIRSTVQSLDPALRLTRVNTISDDLNASLTNPRLGAELLGGFGFLALILAALGTYGVMSYSVSQRTQEIGLRMALGAQRFDVLRLIINGGMAMVGVGVIVGLLLSMFLPHFIGSLLYGIGIFDAASFFSTSVILIGVALLACLIPARRASKVDPMVALRYE